MQITTTKENLAPPLAIVAGAADTRGTVPMLGTVLLKTTDRGQLSLLCSDTGVLARTLTDVDVKDGGEIAVDVRRLHELIRAIPEKQAIDIRIEEKGTLLVKSGRSRFRLPTLPAADYPRMNVAKEDRLSITMSARRVVDMIADISASMAEADLRPYLNGALFSLGKDGLWLVSTDGHRMTVAHEAIDGADSFDQRNVILPRKTVLLAKKLLSQGGNVTLTLGAKNVQFTFSDGAVLLGSAVEGQYPNWRSVIPAAASTITVSADRTGSALKMLMAACEEKGKQDVLTGKVDLHFSEALMTLRRGDAGHCEVDLESPTAAPAELAFNIHYLIDAVETVGAHAEAARIGFSASGGAITVRPKDREYPVVVVMPLRA